MLKEIKISNFCIKKINFFVLAFSTFLVVACGGGSGSASVSGSNSSEGAVQSNGEPTSEATQPTEVAKIISAMESSGQIPVLDRSDSLSGPDENNNGIRDDIDLYINLQNFNKEKKDAINKLAKASQMAVTCDTSNSDSVDSAKAAIENGVVCVFDAFPDNSGSSSPGAVIGKIESYTSNTENRLKNYLKFNALMSGKAGQSTEKKCE